MNTLARLAMGALVAGGLSHSEPRLAAGSWQAHLGSAGGPLRFGLELEADEGGYRAWLVNGAERIEVPEVTWDGETLRLEMAHYDSRITATAPASPEDGRVVQLTGAWEKRHSAETWTRMPFTARLGSPAPADPSAGPEAAAQPVDGRWAVAYESDEDPAVAVFETREDGSLSGTFLTTTGDHRYLAGRQTGDEIELSCFDGWHAFLYRARRQPDGTLAGDFWSRDTWHETWTARRDEQAALPDGFSLTHWAPGSSLAELSFPDLEGRLRSLDDPAFRGGARILQAFGSWCPNCADASKTMTALHRRYGPQGLSILGLAFEVTGDFARDAAQVRRYAERHGVEYPLLVAGRKEKARASEALPIVDELRSFPTTIFLHGDGRVRAVHQGFSGPATGAAHEQLVASFEALVEELLAESGDA